MGLGCNIAREPWRIHQLVMCGQRRIQCRPSEQPLCLSPSGSGGSVSSWLVHGSCHTLAAECGKHALSRLVGEWSLSWGPQAAQFARGRLHLVAQQTPSVAEAHRCEGYGLHELSHMRTFSPHCAAGRWDSVVQRSHAPTAANGRSNELRESFVWLRHCAQLLQPLSLASGPLGRAALLPAST